VNKKWKKPLFFKEGFGVIENRKRGKSYNISPSSLVTENSVIEEGFEVIENKKSWSPMGKIKIKICFFLTPPSAWSRS
jgi:hypothetical protein